MTPHFQDTERGITLYCADCLEILPQLEGVDAVITDPPYGVTQNDWDDLQATTACFDKISAPIVCTCQNPATSELVVRYKHRFKWSDVWEKTQAVGFLNCKIMPMRQHEDILVFANGRIPFWPQIMQKSRVNIRPHGKTGASSNYGKFKMERERTIADDETYPRSIVTFSNCQEWEHPTQKPVPLFDYLISSYSDAAQCVLDPFMGSGTTGIACLRTGRRFIGIEKDPKHFQTALDRIKRELAQQVLAL